MKALIAYGTGRGTTGKIADAIAEGMTQAGVDTMAVSIEYVTPARAASVDLLGIGSPVHFYREAKYVSNFIGTLPRLERKKCFVFCASGMDRAGEALHRLHDKLSALGATVVGSRTFRSSMSYHPHRKRGLGNGDHLPDDAILASAREFGARMIEADPNLPISLKPVSRMTAWKAQLLSNLSFRKRVFPCVVMDRTMCTGYGSCISRCLIAGIDRFNDENIPRFTEQCVQCLECVAWCPRGAIKTDSTFKEWLSTLSYRLGLH